MQRVGFTLAIVLAAAVAALAQQPVATSGGAAAPAIFIPSEANWGPAPDVLPSGAQFVVVDGDPMGTGPYTVRLKLPDGYKLAPHWHPKDEAVTVLDGNFLVGMGDQFSESSLRTLPADSYGKMPANMHHFAATKGETTIQISGMGPFQMTYVNASDDPRNQKK